MPLLSGVFFHCPTPNYQSIITILHYAPLLSSFVFHGVQPKEKIKATINQWFIYLGNCGGQLEMPFNFDPTINGQIFWERMLLFPFHDFISYWFKQ